MTCTGGRDASERTSGIGEDETADGHLVAWWRGPNLVMLVTLRKGNHPGEASVRRGRRKALYRRESNSLKGPHEEAEIQRQALRRRKNLAFSEDTSLGIGKSAVKGDPKKSRSGIETEAELNRKRLSWRLAWWGIFSKFDVMKFYCRSVFLCNNIQV